MNRKAPMQLLRRIKVFFDNVNLTYIKYRLSEQTPDMFAHKLKFILLSQLIATLNS